MIRTNLNRRRNGSLLMKSEIADSKSSYPRAKIARIWNTRFGGSPLLTESQNDYWRRNDKQETKGLSSDSQDQVRTAQVEAGQTVWAILQSSGWVRNFL